MKQIIENLKTLRNGIFKDESSVNALIDGTILLADKKTNWDEIKLKQIFDKYSDNQADPINGLFVSEDNFYKAIKESVPAETLVSLQKAEIEQQENFMKILKDIYKADDMVEMQTLIEIYFENIDSCLLNKYNYESDVSLLSN